MLIQHPAVLSENMVSLYFFLSPQRCRISHRRQCASLLHWNLTIPPSLWPDRELRKYHCPCLALHRRRLQSGICFCETAIAPMGFMACSRRLDQTGMYLKNEYSVFKGHPDFRPYKVSLTRILRFRVGLVGALWLSLQDYIWFVLIFSVSYAVGLGQKNTSLVSQRGIEDDSISYDFTSCIRRFVLQNSLVFFQNA